MRYRSTTGLSPENTNELVSRINSVLGSGKQKKLGRPPILGTFQSVRATLILLRTNLSQASVADLFGVSQPAISRVPQNHPAVGQGAVLQRPPIVDAVAGRVVLIDGTLVPTGNRAGHEHNYSGKRHRAGLSIQVLSDLDGNLLTVPRTCAGSAHDRTAFTEVGWEEALSDTHVMGDSGIWEVPSSRCDASRRTANCPASTKRTTGFRRVARRVERAIAHLKQWRILAGGYRGRLTELPDVIRAVTALEFFRMGW
jgi:hypothetical protein